MRKYIFFLKCSGIVIKVIAWFLLVLGLAASVSVLSGAVPNNPRWVGLLVLAFYAFVFFFLYVVAKITDILTKLINAIEKD